MKRLAAVFLTALLLFSGCESVPQEDIIIESAEPTAEQLALFAEYSVVRPDIASDEELSSAISLKNKLDLTITTDWVNRGEEVLEENVEILVGETNREATVLALDQLHTYRDNYANDFIIKMSDNKVVIVGGTPDATEKATDYLMEKVLPYVDGESLADFEYIYRPEYESEKINGVPAGEYTIFVAKDASDEIRAYADAIKEDVLEKSGYRITIRYEETASAAGIWLGADYGKGGEVIEELSAYRKNCLSDWVYRVEDNHIIAIGCTKESTAEAIQKFMGSWDQLFGEKNNSDYVYRKEYKMITLSGNNIGEYSIYLDENASVDMVSASNALADKIMELTGFALPIVHEPAEKNIRLVLSGEAEVGTIGFDGEDLVIAGGHYASAAGAAHDFLSTLSENSDYANDYAFSKVYDSVPLVSDRYSDMKLVWNDEFAVDGSYDKMKWVQRDNMAQSDIYNSENERNVKVENGDLVLRSWKEEDTSISNGKPYSTNRSITTYDSCNFTYGYLEMRAIVPFGKGCWPSFWMNQRTDMRAEGQDWMAEIDIFEVFASNDSVVPNIHKWYDASKNSYHVQLGNQPAYKFADATSLGDEYHTYGFYWDEEKMVFSVDGEDYCTINITEKGDFGNYKGMVGFHTPSYIILNNFLFTSENTWCSKSAMVDGSVQYPVTYSIDYIRLYQGENGEMYAPNLGQTYAPEKN